MAHQVVVFVLGVLGNIASMISFAAPVPTFVKIIKGKSVFEYRPLPYVVSLLNQLIWLYYGCLLQRGGIFLIAVSVVGCVFQTLYIGIYLYFSTGEFRRRSIRLVLVVVFGIFPVIFFFTFFAIQSTLTRRSIVGSFCVVITIASFAAPLTIVWQVVKTKSIEFMPFPLSLSLTFNAAMWLAYGLATDNIFIEIPNVLGAMLGVGQMVIYGYYRYIYSMVQTFVFASDALAYIF